MARESFHPRRKEPTRPSVLAPERHRIAMTTGERRALAGNNGYADATGCAALSDFAQVSDQGIFLPCNQRLPGLQSSSLPAKN
jgi:hypothetical protein